MYGKKLKLSTQDLVAYHSGYLLLKWGKTPVEFITAQAVNEWLLAPELAHLATSTVKGIVKTLQTVIARKFGKVVAFKAKKESEGDPRCYTAEEVQQIVAAAKGKYKVLFKLAAETGARAGELCLNGGRRALRAQRRSHQQEHVQAKVRGTENEECRPLRQRQTVHDGDAQTAFGRKNRRLGVPIQAQDATG